jgi:phosphomethylpyrimidine synthase
MNKEEKISRTPFPNSTKIYVSGEIHPIKVAMREISQDDTKMSNGRIEKNPPITIYDVRSLHRSKYWNRHPKGLATDPWAMDSRSQWWRTIRNIIWIWKERLNDVKLNDLRFEYLHKPMRAKKELMSPVVLCKTRSNHSEMEYIAIRKPTYWLLQEQTMQCQHQEIVLC